MTHQSSSSQLNFFDNGLPFPVAMMTEAVDHPQHYTAHPSGIECIQVTEHMNFNLGNAVKYIWRADLKGRALQDLKKAQWYIEREIRRLEGMAGDTADLATGIVHRGNVNETRKIQRTEPLHPLPR